MNFGLAQDYWSSSQANNNTSVIWRACSYYDGICAYNISEGKSCYARLATTF